MLIDFERSIVLITPPKCGTVTLHQVLPEFGAKAVLAPQFDHGVGEHTTCLPFDVTSRQDDFRFVVVTRDPFSRVASLYGHYVEYWDEPHLSFEDFVFQIVVAPRYAFFNATIASILEPLETPLDGRRPIAVDEVVRLERLESDLRSLGYKLDQPLPRLHALKHMGLDGYTEVAAQAVRAWAHHDFERFGYSRELKLSTSSETQP